MSERLSRIGSDLIPAVAFGDAAGLLYEARPASELQGISDKLVAPTEHPYYGPEFPVGTWSDDTQLTIVMAEALLAVDGFDIEEVAKGHVRAYKETPQITQGNQEDAPRGWGGSTTSSIRRIVDGTPPSRSGELGGGGNGILMKMAPLVFWQVARNVSGLERYKQYDALTNMTHDSDLARITTRVHGDVLKYLMRSAWPHKQFAAAVHDAVRLHEAEFSSSHEVLDEMAFLLEGEPIDHDRILRETDGKGFKASQTLAMAYGSFMCGDMSLTREVYSAVRLGGDTDSIASIVATMVACASGEETVQAAPFEEVVDIARLRRLSITLAQRALRR